MSGYSPSLLLELETELRLLRRMLGKLQTRIEELEAILGRAK